VQQAIRHLKHVFDPPVSERNHAFSALVAADRRIEVQGPILLFLNDTPVCVPRLLPTPSLDHRTGSVAVTWGVRKHITSAVVYARGAHMHLRATTRIVLASAGVARGVIVRLATRGGLRAPVPHRWI
jgi:hypothetical protein